MLVMCGGSTTSEVDKSMGADARCMPVRCAGCGGGISDRYYLLAVDRQWHASCLTCCQCKVQLDSELTCFSRDGRIYCKEDYYRMFSVKRCTRCHLSISPNELVMRAREHVYHLHCFTCATCNKPLTKGDYFGLREDVIYCRTHYEMLLQYERPYICAQQCLKEEEVNNNGNAGNGLHSACEKPGRCQDFGHLMPNHLQLPCGMELLSGEFQPPRVNGGEDDHPLRTVASIVKAPGQKGRPRKQKNFLSSSLLISHRGPSVCSSEDPCSLSSDHQSPLQHGSSSLAVGSDSSTSSEHLTRPKRMRTSFKHHQLRAMKSYFSINHNPDAKDLKQLSQKTGLSKRVLQVWFQNARAKWRRNLLRQQSQGPEIAQDCKPLSELASQPQFCDPFRLGSSLMDVQPTPITQEEQNIQTFTNLL
ncbi:LIM/homeobox protein Lhx2-like [Argiope bruennichi]|uniref:LIM/homeobox protein Lhx2-like n=1 Tax=Argiope bruennichi TaxID=94029 RepID=UPI002494A3F8|nr:LIM/homeobox protein Lhx2-like [Argiope bruennichi]XP_055949011.1 LIM/homeobox protein Lhx2-like [Argiope bruennichi]XP_055949012.1 LIM/homeobox protein Lhx2-like [Argiope bruennichi]XP_055949013.1 LIM/homeobox protein Lhx2-like [Argiope bruennichi]